MKSANDRRVRKTRALLRQGLVRLMGERRIQDITVTQLCAACDVNRGTFYLHYTDVFQLLHSIEDELLVEFERVLDGLTPQTVLSGDAPGPAMCRMLELLAENADLCRVLLCRNGDMEFVERVKSLVRRRVLEEWGALLKARGRADNLYEYAYEFAVSGCIGLLQCWLEQEMPVPAREMAAMMQDFIAKGMAGL